MITAGRPKDEQLSELRELLQHQRMGIITSLDAVIAHTCKVTAMRDLEYMMHHLHVVPIVEQEDFLSEGRAAFPEFA
jgi:hypothetical protein